MPYKAIKTDDGVKVVEWFGDVPIEKWLDNKQWLNIEPKFYPTLPSDKWELDRVYRDDEVRIAQRYLNRGISVEYAVPNIQEDEWDEAIDEADAAANAKYNFTQTPLMWCEYFISYLRNNYSIKRK